MKYGEIMQAGYPASPLADHPSGPDLWVWFIIAAAVVAILVVIFLGVRKMLR